MALQLTRNFAVMFAIAGGVVWVSTLEARLALFLAIPVMIAVGAQLCAGSSVARLGYLLIPLVALAAWWFPEAANSLDGEAVPLMTVYFGIWCGTSIVLFALMSAGRYMLRRYRGDGQHGGEWTGR